MKTNITGKLKSKGGRTTAPKIDVRRKGETLKHQLERLSGVKQSPLRKEYEKEKEKNSADGKLNPVQKKTLKRWVEDGDSEVEIMDRQKDIALIGNNNFKGIKLEMKKYVDSLE